MNGCILKYFFCFVMIVFSSATYDLSDITGNYPYCLTASKERKPSLTKDKSDLSKQPYPFNYLDIPNQNPNDGRNEKRNKIRGGFGDSDREYLGGLADRNYRKVKDDGELVALQDDHSLNNLDDEAVNENQLDVLSDVKSRENFQHDDFQRSSILNEQSSEMYQGDVNTEGYIEGAQADSNEMNQNVLVKASDKFRNTDDQSIVLTDNSLKTSDHFRTSDDLEKTKGDLAAIHDDLLKSNDIAQPLVGKPGSLDDRFIGADERETLLRADEDNPSSARAFHSENHGSPKSMEGTRNCVKKLRKKANGCRKIEGIRKFAGRRAHKKFDKKNSGGKIRKLKTSNIESSTRKMKRPSKSKILDHVLRETQKSTKDKNENSRFSDSTNLFSKYENSAKYSEDEREFHENLESSGEKPSAESQNLANLGDKIYQLYQDMTELNNRVKSKMVSVDHKICVEDQKARNDKLTLERSKRMLLGRRKKHKLSKKENRINKKLEKKNKKKLLKKRKFKKKNRAEEREKEAKSGEKESSPSLVNDVRLSGRQRRGIQSKALFDMLSLPFEIYLQDDNASKENGLTKEFIGSKRDKYKKLRSDSVENLPDLFLSGKRDLEDNKNTRSSDILRFINDRYTKRRSKTKHVVNQDPKKMNDHDQINPIDFFATCNFLKIFSSNMTTTTELSMKPSHDTEKSSVSKVDNAQTEKSSVSRLDNVLTSMKVDYLQTTTSRTETPDLTAKPKEHNSLVYYLNRDIGVPQYQNVDTMYGASNSLKKFYQGSFLFTTSKEDRKVSTDKKEDLKVSTQNDTKISTVTTTETVMASTPNPVLTTTSFDKVVSTTQIINVLKALSSYACINTDKPIVQNNITFNTGRPHYSTLTGLPMNIDIPHVSVSRGDDIYNKCTEIQMKIVLCSPSITTPYSTRSSNSHGDHSTLSTTMRLESSPTTCRSDILSSMPTQSSSTNTATSCIPSTRYISTCPSIPTEKYKKTSVQTSKMTSCPTSTPKCEHKYIESSALRKQCMTSTCDSDSNPCMLFDSNIKETKSTTCINQFSLRNEKLNLNRMNENPKKAKRQVLPLNILPILLQKDIEQPIHEGQSKKIFLYLYQGNPQDLALSAREDENQIAHLFPSHAQNFDCLAKDSAAIKKLFSPFDIKFPGRHDSNTPSEKVSDMKKNKYPITIKTPSRAECRVTSKKSEIVTTTSKIPATSCKNMMSSELTVPSKTTTSCITKNTCKITTSCKTTTPCKTIPTTCKTSTPCKTTTSCKTTSTPCKITTTCKTTTPCKTRPTPCKITTTCKTTTPCKTRPTPCKTTTSCKTKPTPCKTTPTTCKTTSCKTTSIPCKTTTSCKTTTIPCKTTASCKETSTPCKTIHLNKSPGPSKLNTPIFAQTKSTTFNSLAIKNYLSSMKSTNASQTKVLAPLRKFSIRASVSVNKTPVSSSTSKPVSPVSYLYNPMHRFTFGTFGTTLKSISDPTYIKCSTTSPIITIKDRTVCPTTCPTTSCPTSMYTSTCPSTRICATTKCTTSGSTTTSYPTTKCATTCPRTTICLTTKSTTSCLITTSCTATKCTTTGPTITSCPTTKCTTLCPITSCSTTKCTTVCPTTTSCPTKKCTTTYPTTTICPTTKCTTTSPTTICSLDVSNCSPGTDCVTLTKIGCKEGCEPGENSLDCRSKSELIEYWKEVLES